MNDFGTGPTLYDANPWLRDPAERARQILDVVERNSVIEGLPPLTPELKERIRARLMLPAAPPSEPGE